MATTAQIIALAKDQQFRERLRSLFMLEAAAVAVEVNTTPNHALRSTFAFKLLNTPTLADSLADVLVTRTNLINTSVTYDYDRRAVVTDATDAAIRNQIATDFNMLASVQT